MVEVEVVARLTPLIPKRFASEPKIEGVFDALGIVMYCHSTVPEAFVARTCPGSAPPGSGEICVNGDVFPPPPFQNT